MRVSYAFLYWLWVLCLLPGQLLVLWGCQAITGAFNRLVTHSGPVDNAAFAAAIRPGAIAVLFGAVPLLMGLAAWAMLVYRSWQVVQDGSARTTPGRALGLLFVPCFNLYWIFVAFPGLGSELNRIADQRGLSTGRVPVLLGVVSCLAAILAVVLSGWDVAWPYAFGAAGAAWLLLAVYLWFVQRACQRIAELQAA